MEKMKFALLGTTLAVGLALASGSAFAADLPGVVKATPPAAMSGVYVSVFGGYAFANNVDGTTTQTNFDISVPYDAGYVVGGAVGVDVAPNLRAELELSYVSHNAEGTDGPFASGGGTGTATGSVSTLYMLGNVWYDLDMGGSITPYLGGGLGAALIIPNQTIDTGAPYNTDAWALAGQLGAGIKFKLADNMSIDLGYRAKGVFNASITGTAPGSNLTNVHYIDQTIQAGLTVGF